MKQITSFSRFIPLLLFFVFGSGTLLIGTPPAVPPPPPPPTNPGPSHGIIIDGTLGHGDPTKDYVTMSDCVHSIFGKAKSAYVAIEHNISIRFDSANHQRIDLSVWLLDEAGNSLDGTLALPLGSVTGTSFSLFFNCINGASTVPFTVSRDTVGSLISWYLNFTLYFSSNIPVTYPSPGNIISKMEFSYPQTYKPFLKYNVRTLVCGADVSPFIGEDSFGGNNSRFSGTESTAYQQLQLFPNPFQQGVSIRLPEGSLGHLKVSIWDMLGHKVYEQSWENAGDSQKLWLADLPRGMYFLHATLEGKEKGVYQIIKQ